MERVIDRLILFQQSVKEAIGGQNKFEAYTGISTGYISNMNKNSGGISSDVMLKLKDKFPDLNLDWLITGEGPMLKSEQLSSIQQRLEYFIKEEKIKLPDFCKVIGLPLSQFHNLNGIISEDRLKKIIANYPQLDIGWLMSGSGTMLKSDQVIPDDVKPQPTNINTIKYYPSVSGSMGGVEFLDNPDESSTDIILPGFSECKFAINAYGDSMFPVIKSGQVVLLMEWKESFIDWGHIYMVITKSGYRAIKYLRPSEKEGYIKCESENKESNPAFEVEMNDICKLFLVKGWICRDVI